VSSHSQGSGAPLVNASTVVVLRTGDGHADLQVLMLHKHRGHAFGGNWVFPGGRVDPGDGADGDTEVDRARHAAVREAAEEAGLRLSADDLVAFAHWTPPPESPRRFATWFFVVEARDVREVVIDGGEIADHVWVSPCEALERHGRGEIEVATPTWITLHGLQEWSTPEDVMSAARQRDVAFYATHICALDDMLVAMWDGDAGYEAKDPTATGARHRLLMPSGRRWTYERSAT
jgi:8-oxo-dGTP pyrophosphatase MutT (NUDIX family)